MNLLYDKILAAKKAKKLTWKKIGEQIGHAPVWVASVCQGMNSAPLKSEDVLEVVQQAVRDHGAPDYLRSDNGSEFIAHLVQDWLREHGIKTIYIEPGSPWQNGWTRELPCPLAR